MSQKVREVDQREKQGVGRKLGGGAEGGRAALPQRSGGAQLGPHKGWVQSSGLSPGPQGALAGSRPRDGRVPRGLDRPVVRCLEEAGEQMVGRKYGLGALVRQGASVQMTLGMSLTLSKPWFPHV